MSIGLQDCARLATEPEAGYREVVEFLRAGSPCPSMSALDTTAAVSLLHRHGAHVLTMRRANLDRRILATVTVFEASVRPEGSFIPNLPPGLNVFILAGLRVADEVAGFDPDVATRLIADALLMLATAEADRNGPGAAPSTVLAVADPADARMRDRFHSFGALRMIDPPVWLLDAAAACVTVPGPDIWWLTAASAGRAAQIALAHSDDHPSTRTDRNGTVRRLSVDAVPGWPASARSSVEELAESGFDLNWVRPASAGPLVFHSGRANAAAKAVEGTRAAPGAPASA